MFFEVSGRYLITNSLLIFTVEVSKFNLQISGRFSIFGRISAFDRKIRFPSFRRQISIFGLKFDFSGFGEINGFFAILNFF